MCTLNEVMIVNYVDILRHQMTDEEQKECERLYEQLKSCTDDVYIIIGNTAKEKDGKFYFDKGTPESFFAIKGKDEFHYYYLMPRSKTSKIMCFDSVCLGYNNMLDSNVSELFLYELLRRNRLAGFNPKKRESNPKRKKRKEV